MKIIFLNASPRPDGSIARMLRTMMDEARGMGAEVVEERVSQLRIHPCTGCMTCRSRHECVLPTDDAQRVLKLLTEADGVVIGTPCYWGNMPGTLKVLFDRLVYGLMSDSPRGLPRPLMRGKRAVVVATCTTVWPFNIWFRQSRGAVRAVREVLRWSGIRIVGTVERGATRTRPLTERDLQKCRRLVHRM